MRVGFIAFIGKPNAGKSTLINALVGADISIITRKVQTTRFPVRGIVTTKEAQMIFIDTPGFCKPVGFLNTTLLKIAQNQSKKADVLAIILDSTKSIPEDIFLFARNCKKKVFILLNKIDLLAKEKLLPLIQYCVEFGFLEVYPISALKELYLKDFLHDLTSHLPFGYPLFQEDLLTDLSPILMAAEITRKAIFENIHQEIPYYTHVETIKMKRDKKNNHVMIEQIIFIQNESWRPIILGKNGNKIKQIGMQARLQMKKLFLCNIHLFLNVQHDKKKKLINHLVHYS